MIRFLPSLVEDVRQIAETVKTKGYSLHPASLLMAPRQTMRLLFVPILFRSLRTSDELGIAAELKGVGYSTSISSFRHQKFSGIDYGLLFLTTALFVASFVINKYTKVASTFM
jgi:energy-coupling factor transport system permease protein